MSVCFFVCWNNTRKNILHLLCWEGSKPLGSDHTGTVDLPIECCCPCVPPPHLYSSDHGCMLLFLYLPTFLYFNNVSPSKIPEGVVPVPTPCLYYLACLSVYICGLGLYFFSELVCHLLPRLLFHGSSKVHCRRVSQSQS